jgi:hypothetical protein
MHSDGAAGNETERYVPFADPEKRKAGHHVRPNFDKTPIGSALSPSAEPGAIMRQL